MRLLILTQAVDLDDPLAFFHRWIEEFAAHCEQVHVVCLKEGRHALPKNVVVHSLGKESGVSRLKYLYRFYKNIWTLRGEYDAVFVHMNPEYAIIGGVPWRLMGKRIGLWYVHRSVTWKLRMAVMLAQVVFTATKESMRIETSKRRIVGHAIDTDLFSPAQTDKPDIFQIVSVGRITRIKNLHVLVEAARALRARAAPAFEIMFVGAPVTADDDVYKKELESLIQKYELGDAVRFAGNVSYAQMPEMYRAAHASVNLAPTGGSDKAVLESIACGTPAFVCNRAFAPLLAEYTDAFLFHEYNVDDLADKLSRFIKAPDDVAATILSARVRERFALPAQISTICALLFPAI